MSDPRRSPSPQVKEFQDFRRSLPEESQIIVCKNSLMKKATERVERFLPLDTALAVRAGAWAPALTLQLSLNHRTISPSALPASITEQHAAGWLSIS